MRASWALPALLLAAALLGAAPPASGADSAAAAPPAARRQLTVAGAGTTSATGADGSVTPPRLGRRLLSWLGDAAARWRPATGADDVIALPRRGAQAAALLAAAPARAPAPLAGPLLAPAAKRDRRERSLAPDGTEAPAWRGRLDTYFGLRYFAPALYYNAACNSSLALCTAVDVPGQRYPYMSFLRDPTDFSAAARPVLKTWYPQGSWSPESAVPGGTLFYAFPYKSDALLDGPGIEPLSRAGAGLEYEVYFPPDFDFVKGGKLPGLGGGAKNGRGCGGGVNPDTCFSFRVMWRRGGAGEAYLYVPEGSQAPDFCAPKPPCLVGGCTTTTLCDYRAGTSFMRGAFAFQKGAWNAIRIEMGLNTPGIADGKLRFFFNGQKVMAYDTVVWRTLPSVFIEGVTFSTWFGGSDATWAPPATTYTLFRNVRSYYHGGTLEIAAAPPAVAQPLAAAFGAAGAQAVRVGGDDVAEGA
jgi:hypothetical protein